MYAPATPNASCHRRRLDQPSPRRDRSASAWRKRDSLCQSLSTVSAASRSTSAEASQHTHPRGLQRPQSACSPGAATSQTSETASAKRHRTTATTLTPDRPAQRRVREPTRRPRPNRRTHPKSLAVHPLNRFNDGTDAAAPHRRLNRTLADEFRPEHVDFSDLDNPATKLASSRPRADRHRGRLHRRHANRAAVTLTRALRHLEPPTVAHTLTAVERHVDRHRHHAPPGVRTRDSDMQ